MNDVKRRYDQVKEQEAKLQVEASALSTRQSDFNERRSQAMQDIQNERDELSQREVELQSQESRSQRSGGDGTAYSRSVARELPPTEPKSYRSGTVRSRSVTGRSKRGKKKLVASSRGSRAGTKITATPATEPRYEPTKPPSYISNGSSKSARSNRKKGVASSVASSRGAKDVLLFKQDKDGKFKLQRPSAGELDKILARATPCKPRKEKYMRDTPPTVLGGGTRARSKSVGGAESVPRSQFRSASAKSRGSRSRRTSRTARTVSERPVSERSYGDRKKGYVSTRRSGYTRSRTARTPRGSERRSVAGSDRYERRSERSGRSERRSVPPPPSDRRDDASVAESINSYRRSLEDKETRSVRSRGTRGRTAPSSFVSRAQTAQTPGSTAQTVPTTQIAEVVYKTVKNVVQGDQGGDGVAQALGDAMAMAQGGVAEYDAQAM